METLKHIKYDKYECSKGNFKEWDLEVYYNRVPIYYEVKSETNAFKYGNLCVEYENNGITSGIDGTLADYWVHYAIKDKEKNIYDLFIIPTANLRQMIKDKKYYRDIIGGDNKKTKCYLFKMTDLEKYKINTNIINVPHPSE